jgi:hypothetical protein
MLASVSGPGRFSGRAYLLLGLVEKSIRPDHQLSPSIVPKIMPVCPLNPEENPLFSGVSWYYPGQCTWLCVLTRIHQCVWSGRAIGEEIGEDECEWN